MTKKYREAVVKNYLKNKVKGDWIDRIMYRATYALIILFIFFVE